MILAALAMLTATSVGCNSTRQTMSRCRLFGNRGAQCDACTVPPAQCCPQPCCDPCGGGYVGSSGYYDGGYANMAPTMSGGSCCGGSGGMMPQEGMIYGGGMQMMPGPTTGPMIVPTQPSPGPETSLQP
jgi:hypothetical protein